MAPGTETGVVAHQLCARCLHAAAGTGSARLAEQTTDLQPAVSRQCRNSSGDRPRSPASWSRDRLLQRAPYLGSATATSPPCSLRARRRRSRSRSLPLGLLTPLLLSSRQSAQPCLPRQVCCRTQARLSGPRAPVPRQPLASSRTTRLHSLAPHPVSPRLGCLLEAAFRRARTCAALSRRLHSS